MIILLNHMPQPNPYNYPTKTPIYVGGCKSTRYGCCPDGRTPASGYGNKGCYPSPKPPIDVYSPKPPIDVYSPKPPIDVYSPKPPTDDYTSKPDNYPIKPPSYDYPKPQPNPYDYPTKPPTNDYPPNPPTYGCKNTRYGCCPDGRTPASGYGNRGCY
uniref:Uncharacterized protein n=1 Tax=Biomphalaria glabrata TaxID=6526 RepID=A0A2C9L0W0_BIOGL